MTGDTDKIQAILISYDRSGSGRSPGPVKSPLSVQRPAAMGGRL